MERKSLLADNAMTTLETMLDFLGITETDDSTKNNIERLINAASSYIETMTNRKFALREYTETHFPTGYQELCLKQYPIREVMSVEDTGYHQKLDPESYSFADTGDIGVLFSDAGWELRGYRSGLANDLTRINRCLKVKYQAGYVLPKDATEEHPADLLYDLQYIVWQMVQQQWNLANNGANGLAAFSISDVSWTFDHALSEQVQAVINQYMRWA